MPGVLAIGILTEAMGGTAWAAPVLTSIRAIRRLSADAARQNEPVHIQGVVTYYDVVAPNLFVQDATGGIWVDLRGTNTPPPRVGQLVDLQGTAGAGFSPYVGNPRWRVIGKSAPPRPSHLSYEQAITGGFDSQWAEMDGVVRAFMLQAEGNVLVIDVVTPTGSFKVRVPGYQGAFPMHLVDAKVRFRGVCGTAFNRQKQIVGVHLLMPGMDSVEVLVPAQPNPFDLPTSPISSIRRFSSDLPDVHRVKVKGTVTARFPGEGLFLMDSTGGVYVHTDDGAPVKPGDEVEVAGFPAVGDYSPVLQSGAIRPTGRHTGQSAVELTGKMGMWGGYDARLVKIRGILQSRYTLGNENRLVLESIDHVRFEAGLRRRIFPQGISATIGSVVELTGVCSIKADENGNPGELEIVLRSPADVHILSSPPWLNARRFLLIALGLGLAALGGFGWVAVLRRQVRRQTRLMARDLAARLSLEERYRRTFERNLTGLFIAEQDGTVLECNEACARILGFRDRTDMLSRTEDARHIIRGLAGGVFVADSLVNSEHHFERADGNSAWVLSNVRLVPGNGRGAVIEGGLVDISERKLADERIQYLAYYDALTGLPNRALLLDRLNHGLARARRRGETLAVLFLDVDWFKHINDSLGHSCGDRLLTQVADHLCACAREQDTVARLGGDEFIVILEAVSGMEEVREIAERFVRAIDAGFEIDGRRLNITCSIGIATFPDDGEDVDSLIKNADAAMYVSKDAGRNRFSIFTPEMAEIALERLTVENNLRTAMERGELSLVFQPEFSVETGEVICYEALIRWQNPELGDVPPERFVPVAERTGTITAIGEWVLREACRQAKAWDGTLPIPRIAVNVSEVQLRQEGFCAMVRGILNETGLAPRHLELELTESLLVSRDGEPSRVLEELHGMGISLAIDDFGTGYSSLGYLRHFPVEKLKIDRSFIRDLATETADASIVGAMISMARSLGLQVTAEGVENEGQLAVLRGMGCQYVQGFLLCPPVPAGDLTGCFKAGRWPVARSEASLPV